MVHGHHSPLFAALSLLVAVLGSWTALDLFDRVSGNFGKARSGWLVVAALAMGLSIWSMHFVAMLGFDPGSQVSYDPWLTVASLVLAIGATGVAFQVAASADAGTRHVVGAGLLMGAGICSMHYVGMAALRTAASLGYRPALVIVSLAIAVGASTTALFVARSERQGWSRAVAAVTLGLAIVGMHYTAMAALRLTPVEGAAAHLVGPPPYALAFGVAGTTVLILFLALMASLHDQRVNILAALDAGGVGYWELDLANQRLHMSPRGRALVGMMPDGPAANTDTLGGTAPGGSDGALTPLQRAILAGTDYDSEYRIAMGGRWLNARGRVLGRGGGRATRMVGVVMDVTDRREAMDRILASERRQRLLVDELNHRVKNTLATVQSISRQTARTAGSFEAFHRSFEGRLMALSATHNILTRHGWERGGLREIFDHELAGIAAGRVTLAGNEVELGVREALALGMVAHELVANALAHGALGRSNGHVAASWRVATGTEGDRLAFEWRETGTDLDPDAIEDGFGLRLIRRSIEGELDGQARMEQTPDGLCWRFDVPLRAGTGLSPGDA